MALLAACGGGGDSSGPVFGRALDLNAIFTTTYTQGVAVQGLRAQYQGVTYTLDFSFQPLADASFEGAVRHVVRQVATLTGGGLVQTSDGTGYFDLQPLREVGGLDTDGAYTVMTLSANLPTAATAGSAGTLGSTVTYADATKQTVVSNGSLGWSVEDAGNSAVYVCRHSEDTETDTGDTYREEVCLLIDSADLVVGGRVLIEAPGVTLDFR